MIRKATGTSCLVLIWASAVTMSCGSSDPTDESQADEGYGGAAQSSGGAMTGGIPGATATGGMADSGLGGSPGAGGAVAAGGTPGVGGAVSAGGTPGTGGAVPAGGMPGVGGAVPAAGGAPGAGGLVAAEGTPAAGGAPDASGGAVGLGGANATGGAVATGGVAGAAGAGTAGEGTGGEGTGGEGTGGAGGEPEWPQCYAGGVVPEDDAQLLQRAPSDEYAEMHTHGGVAMLIGPDRPSCLTQDVIDRDLQDLNQGIIDVVEILEFPAFPDWENGYYLNWVILNSGIPNATLSGEGGYQGDRWGHMSFESTQDCPCTWDNYNQGAALHECIHALQAELWAFNNRASGWIHEAHNIFHRPNSGGRLS